MLTLLRKYTNNKKIIQKLKKSTPQVGWSRPLFYKKIGRQAESLSAHKWREKTERSVVDAGRRTVGSTQVCRLGVVVAPGSKGVIPLALKKLNLKMKYCQSFLK